MSDREFREIELGTKQVIFIVMSTVVIAVVIFLLGVAVGRGVRGSVDGTDGEVVSTEPLTPATPATEAGGVEGKVAGKTEPELDYHDLLMGQSSGAAEAPPTEAPPPTQPPVEPPQSASEPVAGGTAPTPSGEAWYLQVGAYGTNRVAEGQVAAVKKLNLAAFVLPPGNGVKLFRVRVGPFSSRAQADEARTRLVREGFKPSVTK